MVCKNAAVQSFERHRAKHSLCNRLSAQRGLFVPIRRRSQMPVRACRQAVRLQSSFAIKKSNERVFCINSVVQGTNKLQCSHKQYFQQSLWIRQGSCRAATKNAKEIFFLLHWNRGAECANAAEQIFKRQGTKQNKACGTGCSLHLCTSSAVQSINRLQCRP